MQSLTRPSQLHVEHALRITNKRTHTHKTITSNWNEMHEKKIGIKVVMDYVGIAWILYNE